MAYSLISYLDRDYDFRNNDSGPSFGERNFPRSQHYSLGRGEFHERAILCSPRSYALNSTKNR